MSRDLWVIGFALFTWGIGEGMFTFFQPLYLQQLGADPVRIGAIMGALSIAMASAHIPAGYLADRFGRRPVIWASWLIGLLAAWIMALAKSLPVFVIGLLIYGVTFFINSPLNSYITVARGKMSVGRAITLISGFFSTGAMLGPLAGGWIGDHFGLQRAYLSGAILFVVSNLIIFFLRPQPVDQPHPEEKSRGLVINRSMITFMGIVFLAVLATNLPQPLSPNYLQNQHHLTFGQIGQLGAISNLGVIILNLTLGQVEARTGFLLAQAAVGVFALLLWQGHGLPWFALGYFLMGGFRTVRALAVAQTRQLVTQSRLGLAYGVIETVGTSAMILSALLAGFLYKQNPTLMYTVSIGLVVLSILVSANFSPARVVKPTIIQNKGG